MKVTSFPFLSYNFSVRLYRKAKIFQPISRKGDGRKKQGVWMFSFDTKREPEKCALCGGTFCLLSACRDAPLGQRQGGVFRLPPPYLWTPPTPQCNNCDRRQRRKQGAVVGAAASKTRVPPKARSGCWVPQPVAKGCSPLTILKQKSKHKKASAAPVGAIALTLFSLLQQYPLSRCATAPPRGSKPLPLALKCQVQ